MTGEPTTARRSAASAAGGRDDQLNWGTGTWLLLVVICGALFLDGLDVSMIGVALPSIGRALHMQAGSLQWVVSGYVLGYGGFLLLGGRTADLVSRRAVFLSAVAVFGVASVLSAVVDTGLALIAFRFAKGAAAGFTVPAGLSILTTTFAEGPARNRALGVYTLCGASGFSLGLVFGGLLTEVGWRAPLLAPGPVALLLVAAGWRVIPRGGNSEFQRKHFDLFGALTATAALLLLVYAVVQIPKAGLTSLSTAGALCASATLVGAFLLIERRHTHPLVRLGILRSKSLIHANLGAAAMYGSYAGFQFLVTLYVQDSLGWSPIGMAMAFLPIGLIVVLLASRIDVVIERWSTPVVILGGFVALVFGYSLFLRARPSMPYVEFMLPTTLLLGTGFGLCFAALNAQATSGVVNHEQGLASGLLNTSLQIGGALGLAIVSAILGSTASVPHNQLLPHTGAALAVVVAVSAAAVVLTAVYVAHSTVAESAMPPGDHLTP